jgi:CheY-like chemotaxis protein
MSKIFILEDSEARIEWFREELGNIFDLTITTTSSEAIASYDPPYDLILLDHDLGGEIYVNPDEGDTGFAFCKFLTSTYKEIPCPVVIHSMNHIGAHNMKCELHKINTVATMLDFSTLRYRWTTGDLEILGIRSPS